MSSVVHKKRVFIEREESNTTEDTTNSGTSIRVKAMSVASTLSKRIPVQFLFLISLVIFIPQLASAQPSSSPEPSLEPLETELLKPDASFARPDIITANTLSPTDITTPSFWWAKEQFDEFDGKLINNWIAYQDKKRLDLVVNSQLWSLLDYMGRYRFVNKFGTAARYNYQYDVRVFNQQAVLEATYTCNYTSTVPDCAIRIFNSFGQDSLPVPRKPLGSE